MNNKWERRDNKRKNKDANFKFKDYDLLREKELAKKLAKQKRAWATINKDEEINNLDDEDTEDYIGFY